MRVIKVLNNSLVLALNDEGQEIILPESLKGDSGRAVFTSSSKYFSPR